VKSSPQYTDFVWLRSQFHPNIHEIQEVPTNDVPLLSALHLVNVDGQRYLYSLVAVLVHTGSYVPGQGAMGHYYVCILTANGWARCDDSAVSAIAEGDVINGNWNRALYKRGACVAVACFSLSTRCSHQGYN
jgi:hypothetical protein